jgi:hypothetical protein
MTLQNSSVPIEYFCTRISHSSKFSITAVNQLMLEYVAVKKGDAIYAYGGIRDQNIFNETYLYGRSIILSYHKQLC